MVKIKKTMAECLFFTMIRIPNLRSAYCRTKAGTGIDGSVYGRIIAIIIAEKLVISSRMIF